MPYAVQCVKPASVSSTKSTSSAAPCTSRHVIVGAVPAPSHVSARGIGPPSSKSGVANWMGSGAAGSGRDGAAGLEVRRGEWEGVGRGGKRFGLGVTAAAREKGERYERAQCSSARFPAPSSASGIIALRFGDAHSPEHIGGCADG